VKETARSDAERLDDMRDSLRRIAEIMHGLTREQFIQDLTAQDAVSFRIMALGEAAGRLSNRTRNAHPTVPWNRISDFRHQPAHAYFELQPSRIWEFVQDDLSGLETKLRKIRAAPQTPE